MENGRKKLVLDLNSTRKANMSDNIPTPRSKYSDSSRSFYDQGYTPRSGYNSSLRGRNNHEGKLVFESIRNTCLNRGVLFEDPDFPAEDKSLFFHHRPNVGKIVWKRPYEIAKNPKFVVDGISRFDIVQGKIGDCWLVAAFACMTLAPSLVKRCIPSGQGFDDKYAGIFHFRFWRYGDWTDVIIDDRLPTIDGELVYLRSSDPYEFWPPLFEKAYAKLYGSYENVNGGFMNWAMQDITGGIVQSFNVYENPKTVHKVIDISMQRASLLGASISTSLSGGQRRKLHNGLVTGHAYSITGYAEIPVSTGTLVLIRLRNPWGAGEWNGPFSDGSPHWNAIDRESLEKIKPKDVEDGEFWMSFIDFTSVFTSLEVCHLTPECWQYDNNIQHRKTWKAVLAHRQWRRGYNAGGGAKSPIVSSNCQFYLELKEPSCVVISLMQKYRICGENRNFLPCSCLIYQAPQGRQTRLGYQHFLYNKLYASTGIEQSRDNVGFFSLPAGCYVIVPATSYTGLEGKFLLRIFTDGQSTARELDETDETTSIQNGRVSDQETFFALKRRFFKVTNQAGEIDAVGLQTVLGKKHDKVTMVGCCESAEEVFHFKPVRLPLESCKAAIAIVDQEVNGRLTYEEFKTLLQRLMIWEGVFQKFSDGHMTMDTYGLRHALKTAGFSVSNKTLEALVIRFAIKETISLEGFINALIKLSIAHQRYNAILSLKSGTNRKLLFEVHPFVPERPHFGTLEGITNVSVLEKCFNDVLSNKIDFMIETNI